MAMPSGSIGHPSPGIAAATGLTSPGGVYGTPMTAGAAGVVRPSMDDGSRSSSQPTTAAAAAAAAALAQRQQQAPMPMTGELPNGSMPMPVRTPPVAGAGAAAGLGPAMTTPPAPSTPERMRQANVVYPWGKKYVTMNPPRFLDETRKPPPGVLSPPPFPRYGHATNQATGSNHEVYIFGGLVRDSVKNDMYIMRIEPVQIQRSSGIKMDIALNATLVQTSGHAPLPRVGHAAVLVSNVFILWGGDTKMRAEDPQDEALYLLNLNNREWTRVLAPGVQGAPGPVGRHGHTLSIIGSNLFVYGGQVDDEYYDELWRFDLNTLKDTPVWQHVQTPTGGPPRRAGHSAVVYKERLYIFGGTDGQYHYNDTWCFDFASMTWSELKCVGYIPTPREGHAACMVDDIMYIFGGRGADGNDLGDLASFKISSHRWFMFAHMGPAPFGRSGHTMVSVQNRVLVIGGESFTGEAQDEPTGLHVLDTSKIKYPIKTERSGGSLSKSSTSDEAAMQPPPQSQSQLQTQLQPQPQPQPQSQPQSQSQSQLQPQLQPQPPPPESAHPTNPEHSSDVARGAEAVRHSDPPRQMESALSTAGAAAVPSTGAGAPPAPATPGSAQIPAPLTPSTPGQTPMTTMNNTHERTPVSVTPLLREKESNGLTRSPENDAQPSSMPDSSAPATSDAVAAAPMSSSTPSSTYSTAPAAVRNVSSSTMPSGPPTPALPYAPFSSSSQPPQPSGMVPATQAYGMEGIDRPDGVTPASPAATLGGTAASVAPQPRGAASESWSPHVPPAAGGSIGTPTTTASTFPPGASSMYSGMGAVPNATSRMMPAASNHPPEQTNGPGAAALPYDQRAQQPTGLDPLSKQHQPVPPPSYPPSGPVPSAVPPSSHSPANMATSSVPTDASDWQRERPAVQPRQLFREDDSMLSFPSNREIWLASTLALAVKQGFVPPARVPSVDEGLDIERVDTGPDNSMKEALIKSMLSLKLQATGLRADLNKQMRNEEERVAAQERARVAALQEAAFYRAKLAANESGLTDERARLDRQRIMQLEKLVGHITREHGELERKVSMLVDQTKLEARLRQLAEDRLSETTKRALSAEESQLKVYEEYSALQKHTYETEAMLRDHAAQISTLTSRLAAQQVERDTLDERLSSATRTIDTNRSMLTQFQEALAAAHARVSDHERQHSEQQRQHDAQTQQILQLRNDLQAKTAELEMKSEQLEQQSSSVTELESMVQTLQREAQKHREAATGGLAQLLAMQQHQHAAGGLHDASADGTRETNVSHQSHVQALQDETQALRQLHEESRASLASMATTLQQATDRSTQLQRTNNKLFAEITSQRKQLASALHELSTLRDKSHASRAEDEQHSRALEAAQIRNQALKQMLHEHKVDVPDDDTLARPEFMQSRRVLELQRELDAQKRAAELNAMDLQRAQDQLHHMNQEWEVRLRQGASSRQELESLRLRAEQAERRLIEATEEHESRTSQLENDYLTAVQFVRNTENMLRRLKEEHLKLRHDNAELRALAGQTPHSFRSS